MESKSEYAFAKTLNGVWGRLQDDLSKSLFKELLINSFDPDYSHIAEIIRAATVHWKQSPKNTFGDTVKFIDELMRKARTQTGEDVVIYGAGVFGAHILASLTELGYSVPCFCDSNTEKQGGRHRNLPIVAPTDPMVKQAKNVIIAIEDRNGSEQAAAQLKRSEGVYRIPGICAEEYFDQSFLVYGDREVYLDLGAYNAKTLLRFAEACGYRYEKIYAMEPDPQNYDRMVREIADAGLQNVEPMQCGAWSHSCTLSFGGCANQGSRIVDKGNCSIKVVAVDELGVKPTFIKMDVEGAELKALHGAKETIQKYKPQLAICIYHNPGDIIDIPAYICSLAPEYKFYIRHHSFRKFSTVLYAC